MKKVLIVVIVVAALSCQSIESGDVIFSNVHVVDGNNAEILTNRDVIIEGDTVKSILDHGSMNIQAARIIDGPVNT